MNKQDKISKQFEWKSQREAVLHRPEKDLGSTKLQKEFLWIPMKIENNVNLEPISDTVSISDTASVSDIASNTDSKPKKQPLTNNEVMIQKEIEYCPAFMKIFDEILTNAADNFQRDSTTTQIKVTVDPKTNTISICNNGSGIPIIVHSEHNRFIPDIIFGELNSSSNYDDSQKRTTGGRNGLGAKLTNIFSKIFIVETVDSKQKKKYVQVFQDNMTKKTEPKITKSNIKSYTKITYVPDIKRFDLPKGITNDIFMLMKRRTYDISACLGRTVNVFFNDEKLLIKDFKSYMDLFIGENPYKFFKKMNDRWEFGVSQSTNDGFQQVSMVNSIDTHEGGTHVTNIITQLVNKFKEILAADKETKDFTLTAEKLKSKLFIFVNCLIENPEFSSQTKEKLTSKVSDYGSKITIDLPLAKEIFKKVNIKDLLFDNIKSDSLKNLSKTDGSKVLRLSGIPKLDDAELAGGKHSTKCVLILTEGDSAKTFVVSGLGALSDNERKLYGCFPLKGKSINVTDATVSQLETNTELIHIKNIMGLKIGKVYTEKNLHELRYGAIMIATDADTDGSHIKGLIFNLFNEFWPDLLKVPNFVTAFITPVVKVTKKGNAKNPELKEFLNLNHFDDWKRENDSSKWEVKYYKGLGTSTPVESKRYFKNINQHRIIYRSGQNDKHLFTNSFNKKYADSRKEIISKSTNLKTIDYFDDKHLMKDSLTKSQTGSMTFEEFLSNELVMFWKCDLIRSIPNIMDGLKPSQRKILYTCLEKNIVKEKNVSRLAGLVGDTSDYHHGEASLNGTIISMAQNYPGSNNMNLLFPAGQFGTRQQNGKDSASPRYIFTHLSDYTKKLFIKDDTHLLKRCLAEADNKPIEPEYYVPTLPMCLVNGAEGIGTGWSTNIPSYNPKDLIHRIYQIIELERSGKMIFPNCAVSDGSPGQTSLSSFVNNPDVYELIDPLVPWYNGFLGEIREVSNGQFNSYGHYNIIDENTIEITELPVNGLSMQDYDDFLQYSLIDTKDTKKVDTPKKTKGKESSKSTTKGSSKSKKVPKNADKFVVDFVKRCDDVKIYFKITFEPGFLMEYVESGSFDELEKKLKLVTTINTSNMVLFDHNHNIQKYKDPRSILLEYYRVRVEYYKKRKAYLEEKYKYDLEVVDSRIRFLMQIMNDELVIYKKKREIVYKLLEQNGYKLFDRITYDSNAESIENLESTESTESTKKVDNVELSNDLAKYRKGYKYLLDLKFESATEEELEKLKNNQQERQMMYDKILKDTCYDLWNYDISDISEL